MNAKIFLSGMLQNLSRQNMVKTYSNVSEQTSIKTTYK